MFVRVYIDVGRRCGYGLCSSIFAILAGMRITFIRIFELGGLKPPTESTCFVLEIQVNYSTLEYSGHSSIFSTFWKANPQLGLKLYQCCISPLLDSLPPKKKAVVVDPRRKPFSNLSSSLGSW